MSNMAVIRKAAVASHNQKFNIRHIEDSSLCTMLISTSLYLHEIRKTLGYLSRSAADEADECCFSRISLITRRGGLYAVDSSIASDAIHTV